MMIEFVIEHLNEDTSRLIMNKANWPDIDMNLAVNCIESRRKLKGKVQEWYDEPRLIFPRKISAEQCSSSATAQYKAQLAADIAGSEGFTLADLTGGFGVDSWFFSKKAGQIVYCEMLEDLCQAARHYFSVLGADNIDVNNVQVSEIYLHEDASIFTRFKPDIVYLDPARRGEGGKKVFLLEDCTPDVLTLKDELFGHVQHILLKLSPMADITMACRRLGPTCREVHVVASGGECKELLIWLDRDWSKDYRIHAVELHANSPASKFSFIHNGSDGPSVPSSETVRPGLFLFEPGKSLMKAGAFDLIASRFCINKLARSTHYYTTDSLEKAESLQPYGKVFSILDCLPLNKRSIRDIAQKYPKAEVTARNIPMDTDTLRKKSGIISGDDAHIFALKSDKEGNLLIAARRI